MSLRVLITGICGFVGSKLALKLSSDGSISSIVGIDNLNRPGSWTNVSVLQAKGIEVHHGDVRLESDVAKAGANVDWVIDAAATPSVLAGVNSTTSSRQLVETNLLGTVNLLEQCKRSEAGLILLSTSRVYSIPELAKLPIVTKESRFEIDDLAHESDAAQLVSPNGIKESFSTRPPISLYGATKLSSEALALEYAHAFDMPLWINRCGVMAGPGQFGRPDQGIFAFWLHSWREKAPLRYLGFEGTGRQVRDCLHPSDLGQLVLRQLKEPSSKDRTRVMNVSGGPSSSMSLLELSRWCEKRWGPKEVEQDMTPRQYDLPWIVLDSNAAAVEWEWRPQISTKQILQEIADFADENPDWLSISKSL